MMMKFYTKLMEWAADREGVTAIEYALMAGFVSMAFFATASIVGADLGAIMDSGLTGVLDPGSRGVE